MSIKHVNMKKNYHRIGYKWANGKSEHRTKLETDGEKLWSDYGIHGITVAGKKIVIAKRWFFGGRERSYVHGAMTFCHFYVQRMGYSSLTSLENIVTLLEEIVPKFVAGDMGKDQLVSVLNGNGYNYYDGPGIPKIISQPSYPEYLKEAYGVGNLEPANHLIPKEEEAILMTSFNGMDFWYIRSNEVMVIYKDQRYPYYRWRFDTWETGDLAWRIAYTMHLPIDDANTLEFETADNLLDYTNADRYLLGVPYDNGYSNAGQSLVGHFSSDVLQDNGRKFLVNDTFWYGRWELIPMEKDYAFKEPPKTSGETPTETIS